VLEYLMSSPGRVFSRTMILEHVWDQSFEGVTNIVDVYVRYLRRKVDDPFPGQADPHRARRRLLRPRASSRPAQRNEPPLARLPARASGTRCCSVPRSRWSAPACSSDLQQYLRSVCAIRCAAARCRSSRSCAGKPGRRHRTRPSRRHINTRVAPEFNNRFVRVTRAPADHDLSFRQPADRSFDASFWCRRPMSYEWLSKMVRRTVTVHARSG
jgi:hypothetical protein